MNTNEGIAIVGLDCRYPGAAGIGSYWENILALRQQFRQIPSQRLNMADYYSADKTQVDSTYSQKAAVLQGYHFDRSKFKVGKSTFEQTDMAHWLALDVADGALRDAGFTNGLGLNKQRVGVIVGNSLAGEFTRANVLRLRWPYVAKVMAATLADLRYASGDIESVLQHAEDRFKEPFPEPDADMLAGGLSNTIAGRICNYFDFNGGGITVDGACASSLLAIENGCKSIESGDLDVAIVGGVDLSIDPFEIIGFARNGALAANEMEVYNAKSAGFWPGEGCGMMVLMRTSEALARGANVYAVIRGWGMSSDGNGGITRPKAETQSLAFERAYRRAGYGMDSVAMIEGHGTGTTLGDKIELEAITNTLLQSGKTGQPAVLGSVKHLIGHTKAAAGVAGTIKACLALKNGIIPPSKPTTAYNPLLDTHANLLQLIHAPRHWTNREPMRASVSAMGFGGINVHLTLEQATPVRKASRPTTAQQRLSRSYRDCEVFPISASTQEGLSQKISRLRAVAGSISRAELVDLSSTLCADFNRAGSWNASLVANTPDALAKALDTLTEKIQSGSQRFIDAEAGIFFRVGTSREAVAFLFPGQGAPIYADRGAFAAFADSPSDSIAPKTTEGIVDTAVAQPAIVRASLDSVLLLERFGLEADVAIGHSLGEISALGWAGAFDFDDAVELAGERGSAMSVYGEKNGAMLAIKATESVVESLLADRAVNITGYNGTGSYVVGGPMSEVEAVQQEAVRLGLHNVRLKVSHAFHTPMMKQAALHFNQYLQSRSFDGLQQPVISTVTGQPITAETKLDTLLFRQLEAPVRFTQAIDGVREQISWAFELGPGNALTRSLDGYDDFGRVALNYGGSSVKGLLSMLSAGFVAGQDVLFEELSANRFYRPFDVDGWALDVLVSPCEKIARPTGLVRAKVQPAERKATENQPIPTLTAPADNSAAGIQAFIMQLISDKTEIPLDVIGPDDKLMSQLHINSLAITEIITLVIRQFNKSQVVFSEASVLANADGSIAQLSELIMKGGASTVVETTKTDVSLDRITNWTQVFQRTDVAPKKPALSVDNGPIQAVFGGQTAQIPALETAFRDSNLRLGKVAVFVGASDQTDELLFDFVQFLNRAEVRQANLVALLTLASGPDVSTPDVSTPDVPTLEPVLRTFQLEVPTATALSLTVPINTTDAPTRLLAELNSATKYREVQYDTEATRTESRVSVCFPQGGAWADALTTNDVLLATGGGKGITFESARYLAAQTGLKLVLFGRAEAAKDAELAQNLAKLTTEGITYRYYSVDVRDAGSVQSAIGQAQAELGTITAFLHGAGVNKPKLLNLLTPSDFINTLMVKLEGLTNVTNALDLSQLRLLVGYGSIIAESGMYGNADYAWANDKLARKIDALQTANPNCRALTLEWSVWDETGMGVHLNSIDSLKNKGVWPIPVAQGLEVLRQVVTDKTLQRGRLIVSGRYGNLPTLTYQRETLPTGRFVTNIRQHTPGVEIIADVAVNAQDDLYLNNHVFQGQYVFPTVMILEGIAQLTNAIAGQTTTWNFEDLTIRKPIFVPQNGSNVIRFAVTRLTENTFRAVAQSEDSNYEVNCFEVLVNNNATPPPTFDPRLLPTGKPLALDVDTRFYDDLLFHEGPFRRVRSFFNISATQSLAGAVSNLTDAWFGPYMPDTYTLGDPGLNDAAIHCHQVCRPGGSLLPNGATQIWIDTRPTDEPLFIRTRETYDDAQQTIIDVFVVTASGEVRQFWGGLVLRSVTGTGFKGRWDAHLLAPYLEYTLMKQSGNNSLTVSHEDCLQLIEDLRVSDTATLLADTHTITLRRAKQGTPATLHLLDLDGAFVLSVGATEEFVLTCQEELQEA